MELIQLLDKFQQNLNILTDINTTMGMVFVKQREFVKKLKGTHIITLLKEILLILFKIKQLLQQLALKDGCLTLLEFFVVVQVKKLIIQFLLQGIPQTTTLSKILGDILGNERFCLYNKVLSVRLQDYHFSASVVIILYSKISNYNGYDFVCFSSLSFYIYYTISNS